MGSVAMFFKFESQVFDKLSCVDRFDESSVRRTLARSVEAVTIVKYDVHCRWGDGSGIPLAKVEKFCYICRKFAKANLLIAMTLVPIVRHGVFSFRQIRHILGTYLKENPSQNALRGVFCGVTGTTFEERFTEHYRLTL